MTGPYVSINRSGDLAVLTLARPPSNILTPELCRDLGAALTDLTLDRGLSAVILRSDAAHFSTGRDLAELQQPDAAAEPAPGIGRICQLLEDLPVHVIGALHGLCLGAGAELALACHYRIGARDVQFALPDAALGLVPENGGSQRLPRVIGARGALDLLLSGRAVPADEALGLGILDELVTGDLIESAVRLAQRLVAGGGDLRPSRGRRDHLNDGARYLRATQARKLELTGREVMAVTRIIDAVEAALVVPFDVGLTMEAVAHSDCREDPSSECLIHIFAAERRSNAKLLRREAGHYVLGPEGEKVLARLRAAVADAVDSLIDEGATLEQVDGELLSFGFAEGFFGHTRPAAYEGVHARRVIAALAAEGARLIDAGRVEKFYEIDALAVHGLGFPRRRGGPMKAAQQMGLLGLTRDMDRWSTINAVWDVPRPMRQAARFARGFDELDASPGSRPSEPPSTQEQMSETPPN